jgi:hypothetical protein
MAGSDDIYNGWLGTNPAYGPWHHLSSVWATWYDGYDSCLNALNSDWTWAGTTICAYPGDTNRGHAYNTAYFRAGAGWGAANDSWGYWRQVW